MQWFDQKIENFIRRIRDSDRRPITIGPHSDPTYHRWFVIPRNRFMNIYLHHFHHDDAQDLHYHRMLNISFSLQRQYYEEQYVARPRVGEPMLPPTRKTLLKQHRIKIRLPSTPHRVILERDAQGKPIEMWSLFIGFPQIQEWGFWCDKTGIVRRVHWEIYLKKKKGVSSDYGYESYESVNGCDDV